MKLRFANFSCNSSNYLSSIVLILSFLLLGFNSFAQTSYQDFGTVTGTNSSQTGSTSFYPNPSSGTTWSRAGAVEPNAPVILQTTSNPFNSSGAFVRGVASSSTSVTKFSPAVGYTGGTEFYTSFKVLFGDANQRNTATSGVWQFFQGAGAMYSDVNSLTSNQVFLGLQFTFGASGNIALTYRGAASWINTRLTTTTLSSGTPYLIEIVGNNKSSGTISYTYAGISQTVAVQKFDLYLNGVKIGDELSEGQMTANSSINATTFMGYNSTSNVANIFVDDVNVYNAVPSSISTVFPAMTQQPLASQTLCMGSTPTTLSVTASNATSYQWYSNNVASNSGGSAISGASGQTYTPPTSTAGTFYYYCLASNNRFVARSNVSTLIVSNSFPVVTFTTQPGSVACGNAEVTYATQSGQSNYVWTVPGNINEDYIITSGSTASNSNTFSLRWLTSGSKVVKVNYTNSTGCTAPVETSSIATEVSAGSTTKIAASSCGSYTWHGTSYTASGDYTYEYLNGNGCPIIDSLSLAIIPLPNPVIVGQTGICAGNVNTLSVPDSVAVPLSESFENGFPAGWVQQNNSSPLGSIPDFTAGDTAKFTAHSGLGYISADYRSVDGANNISNWMITPVMILQNGNEFSFWTKKDPTSLYPDRLQVRLSVSGNSTNVGNDSTTVGDFTTLLLDINPTLNNSDYPTEWTKYTLQLSGINGVVAGRFAFRYFVENGGPSGSNGDYIGIDDIRYTYPLTYSWSTGSTADAITVNTATAITLTATDDNGCVGSNTVNTVILQPSSSTVNFTACDSLVWHDSTYVASTNSATWVGINAAGCDSVVTAHIIINYSTTSSFNDTACNTLTLPWGQTVTTSGNYNHTYQTIHGCDSVVTAHIIIHYSTTSSFRDTACNTLTLPWGQTVTTSGNYNHTYQTIHGCDSVVTAHIVINYSTTSSFNDTACNSLTLPWVQTVTASGNYNHTYQTIHGCDSVVTAHVIINYSTTSSFSDTACNTLTLPWGQTVTASGNYNHTYQTIRGCDSVVTAHIVINYSTTSSLNDTACNTLTLPWGQTVTASGNYNHTYQTIHGCDSVVTAHVVILTSTHNSVVQAECESYSWHGSTYTVSGTYTYAYINANGCASIDTLLLTINHETHNSTSYTACESYAWHGTTYTSSGLYTYAYNNADGCASVDTLHLTINTGTHNSTSQTVCESYTWHGTTYTISGVYTYNYNNVNGCPSVDTLHLTVNNGTHISATHVACGNYSWNGTTYTQSGNYTYSYTNLSGCASVDTLHLTINTLPSAPAVVSATQSRCGNGTVSFSATTVTGITYAWYDASTGGNSVATGASFTTPSLSQNTSYYLEATNASTGCVSASRTTVNAVVNPLPTAVAVNGSRCGTGTVTISATPSSGATIDWYEASTGGSALSTGSISYTTPSLSATTTYYAAARNITTGCVSASRVAVTATVGGSSSTVNVVGGSRCGAGTVTLSATAGANDQIDWYAASTGGTALATNTTTFTTPSISATTVYYVAVTSAVAGCSTSSRVADTAKVFTTAIAPFIAGSNSFCAGNSTALTVSTGNALTLNMNGGSNQYVNCGNNAALKINSGTVECWVKTSGTSGSYRAIICKQTAYGMFINGNNLGVFDWAGSGWISTNVNISDGTWHHVAFSFNNNVTNGSFVYIDGVLKLTTTYRISDQSVDLTLGSGISYGSQFFDGSIDEVRIWNVVRSQAQIQSAMNSTVASNSTGLVAYYKLDESTGSSAIDATGNGNNGTVNNSPSWMVPSTSPLGGSSYTSLLWNTGATSSTVTVSTPGTYSVTATDNNGCTATASVTVVQNPLPSAPTATAAVSRCGAGTVTLNATPGAGETIDWYAASSGGTALSSGSTSYTTPSLNATTTYYAQARNSTTGCVSATRTAITVTINALPSAPSAPLVSRCGPGTVTLTATPQSGQTISWFATSTGGSALATSSNTYTTPSITSTTIYYAEVTNSANGCTMRIPDTAKVNPLPQPLISGNLNLCAGSSTQLSVVSNFGNALDLSSNNGSNFITTPDLNNNGAFANNRLTIETWLYLNSIPTNYTGIITQQFNGGNILFAFGLLYGNLCFGTYPNIWMANSTTATVPVNTWTHVAVTYDQTNVKIYVNGVLAQTWNYSVPLNNGSNLGYYIGRRWDFGDVVNGKMDEFRIWNVAKSAAEIQASMRKSVPVNSNGLVAYYKFDEASGTSTADATGHGYTGSLQSGAAFLVPSPLTGGGNYTALWNNGATSSEITVTTPGTYSVHVTDSEGCTADTAVVVTQVPLPTTPTNAVGATRCGAGTVTISATAATGTTIDWYASDTAQTALATGVSSFTTPSISTTTTYYAQARNTTTGCVSFGRLAVTATVNTYNAPPTVSSASRCGNGTVTLTATPANGEPIDWYAAATGGTALLSGSTTFTTPSLSQTTVYYAEARNATNGCGSRVADSAIINSLPTPTVMADGSLTLCPGSTLGLSTSGGNAVHLDGTDDYVQISNAYRGFTNEITMEAWVNTSYTLWAGQGVLSGDFTWLWHDNGNGSVNLHVRTPSGWRTLIFNFPTTGWHHVATTASTTGIYAYVDGQLVASTSGMTETIFNVTNGEVSVGRDPRYNPTGGRITGFNVDEFRVWNVARTQAQIQANMNHTVAPNSLGLVEYLKFDDGTGTTVTNSARSNANGTLNNGATWLVPSPSPLSSGSGIYSSYLWSTGATTSSIQVTTAGSFSLTVTDNNGCVGNSDTAVVVMATLPATITNVTNGTRCGTGTVNLSATVATGETADWYAAATGGTALATGTTSFTTPSITATTTYYVQARNSTTGCVSSTRTPVTATVNAYNAAPTVVADSVCGSGILTLTATPANGEVIDWYAAATGGSPLLSGATTFTTPNLSATTVYYAEARNVVNGCGARTPDTAYVFSNPKVNFVGDLYSCNGASLTLTAAAFFPVLDTISGSTLAVGLRKLRTAYIGKALRLRRSTDNAEQDFGFVGEALDVNAINSWLNGATGYCVKLYDQSGSGNDVASTQGEQPTFVATGLNNRPYLHFNTAQTLYNTVNYPSPFTAIYGARVTGQKQRVLTSRSNNWLLGWWGNNDRSAYFEGWIVNNNVDPENQFAVQAGKSSGSVSHYYKNGTLIATNSGGVTGPNGIAMNKWMGSGEASDCDFTDVILFNRALPESQMNGLYNSINNYYNGGNTNVSTATFSSYLWSTGATTAAATFTTSGTYSVHVQDVNGCTSDTSVTVTITPTPTGSIPVTAGSRCGTGTVVLSATPNAGETVDWYAAASGGSSLATGTNTFTTPSISANTTYYAQGRVLVSGCASTARTPVLATVKPNAAAPVVTASNRCGAGSLTLSASAATNGVIYWYASDTASVALATGLTYTTPSLTTNTVYYVSINDTLTGCFSATRVSDTAKVQMVMPPNASTGGVEVFLIGGGGAGNGDAGGAGGGGAAAVKQVTNYNAGDVMTITVGTGGTGINNGGDNNTSTGKGGDSKIVLGALTVTAGGGKGATRSGASGGTATGGDINLSGGDGAAFNSQINGYNGQTSGSYAAAGGGSGMNDRNTLTWPGGSGGGLAGAGGVGAPQYPTGSRGQDGASYGGGGGGGGNYSGYGGNGAPGIVTIRYAGAPATTGGVITQANGYTTHTFTSNGTFVMAAFSSTSITDTIVARCGAGAVTFSGTSSSSYKMKWYDAATGGNLLASNTNTFTTPALTQTTYYYVSSIDTLTGCESSARTRVTAVVVTTPPSAPTVTGASRCDAGTLTLTATPVTGVVVDWYAASAGGTALATATNSFTTPVISASTTYYAEARGILGGCVSNSRTAVVANVGSATSPAAVVITSSATGNRICPGATVTFTATPTNGGTAPAYQWKLNGNNINGATSSTYTTSTLSNNDAISVLMTSNLVTNCAGFSSANSNVITTTINTLPSVLSTTPATTCAGNSITLSATASANAVIDWYAASTGDAVLHTGSTYTVAGLTATTQYYVMARDTVTGCVSSSVNNNLSFDGTDDYITVNANPALNLTSQLSFSAWIYRNQTGKYDCIIGKDIYAQDIGYSLWVYSDDKLALRFGGPSHVYRSTDAIPAQTWTHVAATYDGTNAKLYLNGTLSGTYAVSPPTANTSNLYIGTPLDAIGNSLFNFYGKMDELSIWNVALSQAQIQAMMNGGVNSSSSGLLAYYPFNEGVAGASNTAVNTLLDATANSFNGALTNFALNGTTSNWTSENGSSGRTQVAANIIATSSSDTSVTICDSFVWYGQTYTSSGTPTHHFTNAAGCDSLVTLHLTIHPSYQIVQDVSSNVPYTWHGVTYTASTNTPTWTGTSVFGCDSTVNLHLTITCAPTTGDTTAVACGSYGWYGTNYTASGDYTHTLVNASGCDSVLTLHLTLHAISGTDTTAIVCGSMNWYGSTYTSTGNYTRTLQNIWGCDSVITLHLTVNPIPSLGAVSGVTEVCSLIGSTTPTVYTVGAVNNVVTYTWTMPTGATLVSGQGTTSIGVTFATTLAATNQKILVTPTSDQGCVGSASFITLSKTIPNIPTAITGVTNICPYIGVGTVTYSCDSMFNATNYLWTVPTGGTIVSGQGSRSIVVSFSTAFVSGSITVTAQSNCGSRSARSLTLTKSIPTVPVAINGPVSACSFIGTANTATYSIASVANATSYLWTLPTGVTLVSGQGTETIVVRFVQGFATSVIKVRSVANCGSSGDRSLSVSGSTYSAPGPIAGPTNACPYIGNDALAIYTIRKVANAPAYLWTMPAGASIVTHLGGTGSNDTSVAVSFNINFVYGSSITVQTTGCGVSAARSIVVGGIIPSMPGIIAGPTNACEFMVSASSPNGNIATYAVRKVSGASSYLWTVPAEATIIGHPGGTGANDTAVQVKFSGSFVSGTITVASANACGSSSFRSLNITRLNPATPSVFDVIQTGACPNRRYTYTLSSMPSNATSVLWTVPEGAAIISGQGTTSITVVYPPTVVFGLVSAQSINNCSSSSLTSLNIKFGPCPSSFAGNQTPVLKSNTTTASQSMSVNVYPNPTTTSFKLLLKNTVSLVTVNVMDVQGRFIKSVKAAGNEILTLGADLKSGAYMIEVISGNEKKTVRVVKY